MSWKNILASSLSKTIKVIDQQLDKSRANVHMDIDQDSESKMEYIISIFKNDTYLFDIEKIASLDSEGLIDLIRMERERSAEYAYEWVSTMALSFNDEINSLIEESFDDELIHTRELSYDEKSLLLSIVSVALCIGSELRDNYKLQPSLNQVAWRALEHLNSFAHSIVYQQAHLTSEVPNSVVSVIINFYSYVAMVKDNSFYRRVEDILESDDRNTDQTIQDLSVFMDSYVNVILNTLLGDKLDNVRILARELDDFLDSDNALDNAKILEKNLLSFEESRQMISRFFVDGFIYSLGEREFRLWHKML